MRFWLSGYRGGCPCPRSREEAHAAGVATGQDGGADKGAVLLPGPSLCSEAARPPLGKGLCHGAGGGSEPQTWCVALPCLLVTEPLPQSATKTVLHPLRAPWAAWVPSWAPIPAHPCSQAPPALWDWGGHLQQLLLLPGLLQVRGASLTPCRVMPPTPVHCRAAPTSCLRPRPTSPVHQCHQCQYSR